MSSKNSKKVCSWAGERKRETGDEGSERHGEGLSWNRIVWCLVATVRPLHFTLRETGVTGGFQTED